MRTEADIFAELRAPSQGGSLDLDVLLRHLAWEDARPFLTDAEIAMVWVPEVQWPKKQLTRKHVIVELDYALEAAWDRVSGHRGISASLSLLTMRSFLWLLDDAAVLAAFEAAPYPMYGAPKLAVLCQAYDLPLPEEESMQNMIQGFSCCESGCESGC